MSENSGGGPVNGFLHGTSSGSSALISTFWIVKFKYADNISAALHLSIFLYLKEFIICKRFGIKL